MFNKIIGKIADKQIKKLGFNICEFNKFYISYTRPNNKYTHKIEISHRNKGAFLISYDPELFDGEFIGNTAVGLTPKELFIFYLKTKSLGWK